MQTKCKPVANQYGGHTMKYESGYTDQRKDRRGQPWVGHLKYRDPETKRWRQVSKTFDTETVRTEAQAEKALQEWRTQMEIEAATAKRQLPGASTSVGEYVSNYIDILEAAGSVRASAISDYRTSCKRITEGIGDVEMGKLTPTMIQEWESGLLKSGRGVNTVLKYHRLLNSVFKHAVNVRDLDWNPCGAVKKPKREAPSPNSLTSEQYARLTATLAAMCPTPTVTAAMIAAFTGMREGEITGLRWKCYDADAGVIRIERAIAKAGGKSYEALPKTEASRRDVPVHPELARALERRRVRMVEELQEAGMELEPDEFGELYVVGSVDGTYLDNTRLSRAWKELSDDFGLIGTQGRRVCFHDLRHSFATRAIAAGADVKAVASVLGHTDARVTLNVYADSDPDSKRRAVTLAGDSAKSQGEVKPFAELAGGEQ